MLNRILFPILTLLLIMPLNGCKLISSADEETDNEPFERRELPRQLSEDEIEVVNGSGEFGFNLMQKLIETDPEQSHFVSPLSILMAYGMTMNGAEGDTYTQMQETFGMTGMSHNQINEAARDLIELLTQFDDKVQFNIANSIWYRETFSVEEDFLATNRDYYNATIEAADFDDPETVDRINSWVDEQTEGLINQIVQRPIDPLTMMFLINAIYFNGDWSVQFDPDNTIEKSFHTSDGSVVETDMMRMKQQENMLYTRGDDYEAVNLYYGDAGYAMTLVLPDEETGLENWINNLTWDRWKNLTNGFNEVTLTLEMPKFEMEYKIDDFKTVLQELGISDAFNPDVSDFSRINPNQGDLHISDTKHKTFIRVDEEGTEAAAVTSVEVGITSAPQSVQLNFDRPFFYVIREVESETILFMGTMTNPDS